jgi:hypothetical protein
MPELQGVSLIEIKECRHLGVCLGGKIIQVTQVSTPFQGSLRCMSNGPHLGILPVDLCRPPMIPCFNIEPLAQHGTMTIRFTGARLVSSVLALVALTTCIEPGIAFPLHHQISSRSSDSSPPSLDHPPIADGIVDRYLLHPLGLVEGLLLRDGSQMHVTSRAAHELVKIIKPGDHVQVYGRRPFQSPIIQPDVIVNVTDGRSLTVPSRLELPIPPAEGRKPPTQMRARGAIQVLLYDRLKNAVNGVLLSDGTQVHLPPDVGKHFHLSLQPDLEIEVEGHGTETEYGRSLEATAIGRTGGPLTHLDASIQQLP